MLVVAFQIEIRFGALRMAVASVRAFEHRGVGGARVEPDLENVGALGVVRRVDRAQYFLGGHATPGFDAALFHNGRRLIEDFHRAWMQFTRVLVQEERDGHAPAALAADAPVGPAGDHVAQPDFAVLREKAGLFNRCQCELTQRFGCLVLGEDTLTLVHADEPLGRNAVDHWRLVAPAMRVAVRDVLAGKQASGALQGIDDDRAGLPDVLPAKQREVAGISPVALYWIQDVVIRQAVCHAAIKVFHAVGR